MRGYMLGSMLGYMLGLSPRVWAPKPVDESSPTGMESWHGVPAWSPSMESLACPRMSLGKHCQFTKVTKATLTSVLGIPILWHNLPIRAIMHTIAILASRAMIARYTHYSYHG